MTISAYLRLMSKQLALSIAVSVLAMVAVVAQSGQPPRETGAAAFAPAPADAASALARIAG